MIRYIVIVVYAQKILFSSSFITYNKCTNLTKHTEESTTNIPILILTFTCCCCHSVYIYSYAYVYYTAIHSTYDYSSKYYFKIPGLCGTFNSCFSYSYQPHDQRSRLPNHQSTSGQIYHAASKRQPQTLARTVPFVRTNDE